MRIIPIFYRNLQGTKDLPDWLIVLFFFGPLFLGIGYLIYIKKKEALWKKGEFPQSLEFNPSNYLNAHICLVAYFIQRDRRSIRKKIDFLTRYFQLYFRNEHLDIQSSLKSSFEYPISPASVAKWVQAQNVSEKDREQLLIFLIQFCALDGLIIDKEYVLLKQVAVVLRFDEDHFRELLAKYGSNKAEAPPAPQRASLCIHFAKILGIAPTATRTEIKQAYRMLTKKHHPDKFASADEAQRQLNQATFIAIQEAYEYLYREGS